MEPDIGLSTGASLMNLSTANDSTGFARAKVSVFIFVVKYAGRCSE